VSEVNFVILLHSIVAGAAPVVLAAVGETVTERAGVVNLSLDGSILLSAMVSFAVSYETQSLIPGFLAGTLASGLVAGTLGLLSICLGQSQVAVGFVLTLTAKDLAYFLGNPYARLYGPQGSPWPVPLLEKMPLVGPIFFQHSIPVYLSMVVIGFAWWVLYRTPMGLRLRAVGENPEAAYARGIPTRRIQMLYTYTRLPGVFSWAWQGPRSPCAPNRGGADPRGRSEQDGLPSPSSYSVAGTR